MTLKPFRLSGITSSAPRRQLSDWLLDCPHEHSSSARMLPCNYDGVTALGRLRRDLIDMIEKQHCVCESAIDCDNVET
jgi:hypothetical protein